jgi:hypothetical protein
MDLVLKAFLNLPVPEPGDSAPLPDHVVEDLIFQQRYGIPRSADMAAASKPPLSVQETAIALDKLRQEIGKDAFRKKKFKLTSLPDGILEAAREYCEPAEFCLEFLEAAAKNDDEGMRRVVRKLMRTAIEPNPGDIVNAPN